MKIKEEKQYTYAELLCTIRALREPDGCPWDRAQTHESLIPCFIEECYEAVDALRRQEDENLCEELGDVLLQVLLHAQIAAEEQRFGMDEIVSRLCRKLVFRHPHVFKEVGVEENNTKIGSLDSQKSISNWEERKQQEKSSEDGLDSIPKAFPALLRAQKVHKKIKRLSGCEEDKNQKIEMIQGMLEELKNNAQGVTNRHVERQMGEMLFQIAGLLGEFEINAENSLTNTVETVINRSKGICLDENK